jgi:hypothetical protein
MSCKHHLKPWAAYVVGHHPFSLPMWLENLWINLRVKYYDHDPQLLNSLCQELGELDDALEILTRADQGKPYPLLCFCRAWEDAKRRAREALDTSDWLVPDDGFIPADLQWDKLQRLQARLLEPRQELDRWRGLGATIGRCQFELGALPPLDEDYVPRAELDAVHNQVARFVIREDGWIPSRVQLVIARVSEPATGQTMGAVRNRIYSRYKDVERLDRELLGDLRGRGRSEPQLILGPEEVTFFGGRMPLRQVPVSELACLWVLAEQPGRPVERNTIICEGDINGSEYHLKSIVSRLRALLRELYIESCQGGDSLPDNCFISGLRAGKHLLGPYRLDLDPSRVLIVGPRPAGMKQVSPS